MNKRSIRLVILIAIAFIATYSVLYLLKPHVNTVKMLSTVYEDKIPFKGIYFAQEYVIYNGKIDESKLKVKNGDKVPSGMLLYDNLTATEAGIVSTQVDGYENKFNPDNIMSLDSKQLNRILQNDERKPGIKIINNSEWYVYVLVDKDKLFKRGRLYDLLINNDYYPSIIKAVSNTKDGNFVLFEVRNDLNIMSLHRGINGYIIKSRYNGTVVPEEAVVTNDGKRGVFVKTHGYAEFRNIEILFEDKDVAVISRSDKGRRLQDYDDIICNPAGLRDGSKIR